MKAFVNLRGLFCVGAVTVACLISRGAPPAPPPPVMVWLYMLNEQENNLEVVLRGEDGNYPFALNGFMLEGPALMKRGQPIALEVPPPVPLGAGGMAQSAGTPPPALLKFTSGPEANNILVLFATNGEGTIIYHQTVDQGEKAIPPGNILVLNLTRAPAAILVGESQAMIGAQDRMLLPVKAVKTGTHSQLVKLAVQVDGTWKPVFQQMLPQKATARRVALLVPDGRGGVVPTMLPFLAPDPKPAAKTSAAAQTQTVSGR